MKEIIADWQKPNKEAVTEVAKKLVRKYPFMKDERKGVSGYVTLIAMLIYMYL